MRLLKWLTVLLAVAGVVALVLASRATARILTPAAAVSPAMNFAYVGLAGTVIDYPTLSPERDYASFRVRDASGEMRVSAYRSAVSDLIQSGRLPMPGDVVTVEGTLRVRDDEPSLVLNASEALSVQRPEAQAADLAALDAMPLGRRATVRAQVRRVRDATSALRLITVRQGNAEADVLFPIGLQDLAGVPPQLSPGDWISVTGGVGEYRGQRQLLPASAQDIARTANAHSQPSPALPLDIRPISALNKGLVNQWVAVRGQATDIRLIAQGALIELQDDSGTVTVVAFDAWADVPFSQTLQLGDILIAQGLVIEYKGRLEIQTEMGIDLVKP